jgi:hypothetical protein
MDRKRSQRRFIKALCTIFDEREGLLHSLVVYITLFQLDEVIFAVYQRCEDANHELLECYNCQFNNNLPSISEIILFPVKVTYNDSRDGPNGVLMTRETPAGKSTRFLNALDKDQIKNQTVSMIRTLVTLTSTLKPLPKDR